MEEEEEELLPMDDTVSAHCFEFISEFSFSRMESTAL